jgi:enamine deaminase RidA (YjgF/YER057c/UK114 family)
MLTPKGRGTFEKQAFELLNLVQCALSKQPWPMVVTSQTIFLRDAADQKQCEKILKTHYGLELPASTYVFQPPCCGAALGLEAWAVGGPSVRVERFGPHGVAVSYHGVRWLYFGGIKPPRKGSTVYAQTMGALQALTKALEQAGSGFSDVVRTWFYLGGITEVEGRTQRYKELNRGRTDFYKGIRFYDSIFHAGDSSLVYPASTGIGMTGPELAVSCTAFQTRREDAFLVPLENPQQTPAYRYHAKYSPQSPKFSRAMALVLPDFLITWVSGTASIVNSESRHPGNIVKQTEQTLDNIERLIAPDNVAASGLPGGGAHFRDLAKVRVYIKRQQDFAKCRAVCERRLGAVPAIYAVADICRPELLVEIEGITFSKYLRQAARTPQTARVPGANHDVPVGKPRR